LKFRLNGYISLITFDYIQVANEAKLLFFIDHEKRKVPLYTRRFKGHIAI